MLQRTTDAKICIYRWIRGVVVSPKIGYLLHLPSVPGFPTPEEIGYHRSDLYENDEQLDNDEETVVDIAGYHARAGFLYNAEAQRRTIRPG